jgi:hypothetical protein
VFSGPPDGFGEYEMLVYRIHSVTVPEPASWLLALTAGGAALVIRQCRRTLARK